VATGSTLARVEEEDEKQELLYKLDSQAQLRPLGVDVLLGLFRRGKGATQRTFCTWGSSQYTPSPPAVDQARPPVLLSAERYADLSQRNRDHNIIKSHSQQSIEIS